MQKVFKGMHQIYSSAGGMSIYPVVFNMQQLLDELESKGWHFFDFWLNSIARYSGGAPVILIGTHKDQVVDPADLTKTNAVLAKTNPKIKGLHDRVRDRVKSLRVYKLKKLRLHMPPQPSLFCIVLYSHVNLLLTMLSDLTL